MNLDTYAIAVGQFFDIGVIGLLAVFLCPMVFGAIAWYYSHKTTDKVTREWWSKFDYISSFKR